MAPIPINLAVEDPLSEAVLRKMLEQSGQPFVIGVCYNRGGFGYLKKTIKGFNNVAKATPFLVLTDLDKGSCPLALITDWLPVPKHPNLIFRVAVKEIEAWLLAHRQAFAHFLGISEGLIPDDVEAVVDPKQLLIDLARRSRRRELRQALVPSPKGRAKVGRGYNGRLIEFVDKDWDMKVAMKNSASLQRAVEVITSFTPTWESK